MGGFTLVGPTYTIKSTGVSMCRCTGFRGDITEDIETLLVNQDNPYLDVAMLPQELQENMMKSHIGNSLHYKVVKHFFTEEEQETMQKEWSDKMIADRNKIYEEITYQKNPPSADTNMLDLMFQTLDTSLSNSNNLEAVFQERINLYNQ
jgi:hypothetical protein